MILRSQFFVLTALSDDSESVVFKVSKPIRSALDEFHFAMEAFGDAVVARRSPHAHDGFYPFV